MLLSALFGGEFGSKPRVNDLELSPPHHFRGTYRIELPAGMRVERLPEAVKVESEFGTLQIYYGINGQILTAVHSLNYSVSRIPAEKFQEFREFVNRASRLGRQRLRAVRE